MTKNITVSGTPTHTVDFQYTADNERILKNEKQGTTNNNYFYIRGNNDYPITEKSNLNNTLNDKIYIYGPTGLIAFKDATTTYFVIKDHLGSTRLLFRSTGTQYTTYEYSSFGSLMRTSINGDVGYRFTGQEYDSEFGLYNFRARLYDDEVGIFYAVDPGGQNFSPFSYAGNNPVIKVDRDGRWWVIPLFFAAITGERIALAQGKTSIWERLEYISLASAISIGSIFAGSFTSSIAMDIIGQSMVAYGTGGGTSLYLNDLGYSALAETDANKTRSFIAGFVGGAIQSFGGPYAAFLGGFASSAINSDEAHIRNGLIGGILSLVDYCMQMQARYSRETGVSVLDKNREEIDSKVRDAMISGRESNVVYDEYGNFVSDWTTESIIEGGYEFSDAPYVPEGVGVIHVHHSEGGPSDKDLRYSKYLKNILINNSSIYSFSFGYNNFSTIGSTSNYFMFNFQSLNYIGRFLR